MDNIFYDSTQRERKSVNTQKTKNKDVMMKIVIIQLFLSLLITGVLYLVCRKDTPLSQNIKTFYSGVCEKDMSVSEIFSVFKNVAQSTFAPIDTQEEATDYTDEI